MSYMRAASPESNYLELKIATIIFWSNYLQSISQGPIAMV